MKYCFLFLFFSFLNRNPHIPQPKPRLSLVKTPDNDTNITRSQTNGSLVQRIKPFFEQQSSIISSKEPKFNKQQRQSVSIPYTYQKSNCKKATCLDDIVSSQV